jgi:hypothetical protein
MPTLRYDRADIDQDDGDSERRAPCGPNLKFTLVPIRAGAGKGGK